jgi:uncharacterized protein
MISMTTVVATQNSGRRKRSNDVSFANPAREGAVAVVVTPVGVRCNLQCRYCYEDPQRDAGNLGGGFDLAAIKETVEREGGGPFLTFGGEPLLLPKAHLRDLWAWGLEEYGGNILQTNGNLIDDEHIELFKKYRVRVGISVDGPEELNDARWRGTLDKTRVATQRTQEVITQMCAEGLAPSLIVILHRLNASAEALPRLIAWFTTLAAIGVKRIGLHLLEVENAVVRDRFELSLDENVHALLRLRQFQAELSQVEFSLLRDIESLMLGDDSNAKCIWRACDPYTTAAVRGVGGRGERSKCGRVIKDGVDYLRESSEGFERYVALYQTPREAGGCKGCRFFLMCRGQCPGTAISGDWRNRSEQCPIWTRVFEHVEADLLRSGLQPLSVRPERVGVEQEMLRNWESGRNPTVHSVLGTHSRTSASFSP